MTNKYIFVVAGAVLLSACVSSPSYQRPTITTNAKGVPSHYLVKEGDTVSQIARRYGLNWQEVARLNRLDGNYTIYTGQWLKLWQGSASNTTTPNRVVIAGKTPTQTPTRQKTSPQSVHHQPASHPNPPANLQDAGDFIHPMAQSMIARQFGAVRQINGKEVKSEGVWLSAKEGDAIVASRAGTVIYADVNSMPDASVAIRHANGFITEYRFIKDATVKAGQNVGAGQPIAYVKSTNGVAVMEFRLAKDNVYIDPLTLIK